MFCFMWGHLNCFFLSACSVHLNFLTCKVIHLRMKIFCNEEKAVKVHHSSVIMSNTEWVFIVSCDTAHMWLVIYGKSKFGSKGIAMSKVCAVVCKFEISGGAM